MRRLIIAIATLALASCTSGGGLAPDVAQRIQNDIACSTALTGLGIQIASGTSAAQAYALIEQQAVQNDQVLAQCSALLGNLAQDAAAAGTKIQQRIDQKNAAPAATPPK